MSRRDRKMSYPSGPDAAEAVRSLRECWHAVIRATGDLKLDSPLAQAANEFVSSLHRLGFLFTGERDYFHGSGAGSTESQREYEAQKRKREAGELSWIQPEVLPREPDKEKGR
ncbi:MAG: hypothetical protein WDN46_24120 [Methylocella sp.]